MGRFLRLDGVEVVRPLNIENGQQPWSTNGVLRLLETEGNTATFSVIQSGQANVTREFSKFDPNTGTSQTADATYVLNLVKPDINEFKIEVAQGLLGQGPQDASVKAGDEVSFRLVALDADSEPTGFPSGCQYDLNISEPANTSCNDNDKPIPSGTNAQGPANSQTFSCDTEKRVYAVTASVSPSSTADIEACKATLKDPVRANNIARNTSLLRTDALSDNEIDELPVACVVRVDHLTQIPANRSTTPASANLDGSPNIPVCPSPIGNTDVEPPIFLGSSALYMAVVYNEATSKAYYVARPMEDSDEDKEREWGTLYLELDGDIAGDEDNLDESRTGCVLTPSPKPAKGEVPVYIVDETTGEIIARKFSAPAFDIPEFVADDTTPDPDFIHCTETRARVYVGPYADGTDTPGGRFLPPVVDLVDIAICKGNTSTCVDTQILDGATLLSNVDYTFAALCHYVGTAADELSLCEYNQALDASWAPTCTGATPALGTFDSFTIGSDDLTLSTLQNGNCTVPLIVKNAVVEGNVVQSNLTLDTNDANNCIADGGGDSCLTDTVEFDFVPAPIVDFALTPKHSCVGRYGLVESLDEGSQINGLAEISIAPDSIKRLDPFCVGEGGGDVCTFDSDDNISEAVLKWAGVDALAPGEPTIEITSGYWDGTKCEATLQEGGVATALGAINTGVSPAIQGADCDADPSTTNEPDEQCYEPSSLLRIHTYCVTATVPAGAGSDLQEEIVRGTTITVLPVADEELFIQSNALCEALSPALESDILGSDAGLGPQLVNLLGNVADPILAQVNTVGGQFPDVDGDGVPDGLTDTLVNFLLFGLPEDENGDSDFPFGLSTITSALLGGVDPVPGLSDVVIDPLTGCVVSPLLDGVELLLDVLLGGLGSGDDSNVPDPEEVFAECQDAASQITDLFGGFAP